MADKKKLEAALEKKALYGEDIDLSKYDDNDEARTKSTEDLTAGGKSKLAKVGIELDGEGRSATFIQVDNTPVQVEVDKETPLELMNTGDAAKKHPEIGGKQLPLILINILRKQQRKESRVISSGCVQGTK